MYGIIFKLLIKPFNHHNFIYADENVNSFTNIDALKHRLYIYHQGKMTYLMEEYICF